MTNPIIAEVTRGPIVESRHRGAFAVSEIDGSIVIQSGDIDALMFPRSAIKAFQVYPLLKSGAALRFGLSDEEIAARMANWQAPEPRFKSGVFHRYAALVSSASEGAILKA